LEDLSCYEDLNKDRGKNGVHNFFDKFLQLGRRGGKSLYAIEGMSMLQNLRNFRVDSMLPVILRLKVGAVLIQEVKVGDEIERQLIYAISRSFKAAETRYLTIRLELLGVSFAIKKFRRFLIGTHFCREN
jgi:hypothetical protein